MTNEYSFAAAGPVLPSVPEASPTSADEDHAPLLPRETAPLRPVLHVSPTDDTEESYAGAVTASAVGGSAEHVVKAHDTGDHAPSMVHMGVPVDPDYADEMHDTVAMLPSTTVDDQSFRFASNISARSARSAASARSDISTLSVKENVRVPHGMRRSSR